MAKKQVAFAPGNKWGQAPFCKKEDILTQKMGPDRKWGLAPFIPEASLSSPSERNRAHSAFLTVFSPYSPRQAWEPDAVDRASMSERSELRSRREDRMENGVKSLKGARLFPKTFSDSDKKFLLFFLNESLKFVIF